MTDQANDNAPQPKKTESGYAAQARAEKQDLATSILHAEATKIATSVIENCDQKAAAAAVARMNEGGVMSTATMFLIATNLLASTLVDVPAKDRPIYVGAVQIMVNGLIGAIHQQRKDAEEAAAAVLAAPVEGAA